MKKKILIIFIIIACVVAAVVVYFVYKNKNSVVAEKKQIFISSLRLSPYVSREKTREVICANQSHPLLAEACQPEYDKVAKNDLEKIDELFSIIDRAKKDDSISDYDTYLIAKVIFVSLPANSSPAKSSMNFSSWLAEAGTMLGDRASAQTPGNQTNFESQLQQDLATVRANCPAEGYQNWTINLMCSQYVWKDGKEQPLYSKEYAEAGGPCVYAESGEYDSYHVQSFVTTKMRSENEVAGTKGVSTQVACSFTCGSYNCPSLNKEYSEKKYCKNPIYRYMGTKMTWHMNDTELADYDRKLANFHEDAASECAERGYSYTKRSDGTSSRKKTKDCKLISGGYSSDIRDDPPDYTPTIYETVCCECDYPKARDPYVSVKDFSDPAFQGGDLLKKLIDAVKKAARDAPPVVKKSDPLPKPAVQDAPAPTPPLPPPPVKIKPAVPKDICCLNSKAKVGERYYIPFEGNDCFSGDQRVPLDKDCANPLPVY